MENSLSGLDEPEKFGETLLRFIINNFFGFSCYFFNRRVVN